MQINDFFKGLQTNEEIAAKLRSMSLRDLNYTTIEQTSPRTQYSYYNSFNSIPLHFISEGNFEMLKLSVELGASLCGIEDSCTRDEIENFDIDYRPIPFFYDVVSFKDKELEERMVGFLLEHSKEDEGCNSPDNEYLSKKYIRLQNYDFDEDLSQKVIDMRIDNIHRCALNVMDENERVKLLDAISEGDMGIFIGDNDGKKVGMGRVFREMRARMMDEDLEMSWVASSIVNSSANTFKGRRF